MKIIFECINFSICVDFFETQYILKVLHENEKMEKYK